MHKSTSGTIATSDAVTAPPRVCLPEVPHLKTYSVLTVSQDGHQVKKPPEGTAIATPACRERLPPGQQQGM